MAAASETLKKVFLELGGKSAAIVLDDADFDMAALFTAFSMVTHAGQGCAITSRMLVPSKHHDEIVEMIKNNFGLVRYGDPTDAGTYMGPLISEKQRDKVDGMVKRAVEAGATLVTGGEKVGPGYFYTPTLLTDVDPDSEIAQEEVFGPVLVVIALRRRRRRRAHRQQLHLRAVRRGVRQRGPRARGGAPHPDRHLLDQRRHVLQPRQPVRRLQAVGYRHGRWAPPGSKSSWSARRSRRWSREPGHEHGTAGRHSRPRSRDVRLRPVGGRGAAPNGAPTSSRSSTR